MITVHVQYFALLQEQRGLATESISLKAISAQELYQQLQKKHAFTLPLDRIRLAINEEFIDAVYLLQDGDTLALLPPMAGG